MMLSRLTIRISLYKAKEYLTLITTLLSTFIALFISANPVLANNADAHVHGSSELALILEGNALSIQLTSPAMNVVGFEYQATSKEDIAAVEASASLLFNHDALFIIEKGECKHVNTQVDTTKLIKQLPHKDHVHKPHHEHNSHDSAEIHEEQVQHSNHLDVISTYQYQCNKASELNELTVNVLSFFPNTEKVIVMWITESKQGSHIINKHNREISLR